MRDSARGSGTESPVNRQDKQEACAGSQPLVSVLTPVYNGERYLDECMASVLRQTYTNWEYVIVDNCSTDRTAEIIHRYAHRDSRIRVLTNERLVGVNTNHNIAFRAISPDSKYCKVVQADDWLFPECIREMVRVAEDNPSVGIVSAYRLDDAQVTLDGLPYPSTVVSGRQVCRQSLFDRYYVFGSPTSLLLRSKVVRQKSDFFVENSPHADTEACYDVLRDWDFGFVHQILTYTRRHGEAQSSRSHRWNTYLLSELRILTKYGPAFLTTEEYQELRQKTLTKYYSFLASKALQRVDKGFWEFHRKGLQELGCPLSRSRLLRSCATLLVDASLNPKASLRRAAQILGQSNHHAV